MKQFLRKVHLWLSVPFGVFITLICLTGGLLIIEKDLIRRGDSSLVYVKPEGEPMEMNLLCTKVLETQPEGAKISGVTIYLDLAKSYEVGIASPYRKTIYVDPYRGEVLGAYERSAFFTTVSLIHRRMLDGTKEAVVGKQVVGVTVWTFVFILISGIVLWWPSRWNRLGHSLKIRFGRGRKVLWYDLHVVLGVFATLILLGSAVTGLIWTYDWFEKPIYKLFGASQPSEKPPHASIQEIGDGYVAWGVAVKQIPLEKYASLRVQKGVVKASLSGWGNARATDDYRFDPVSGELLEMTKYADKERYEKVSGWISSVHLGRWGGSFSRLLTFLAMLIGASLPITGYYLWWKRIYRPRKKRELC